MLQFNFLSRHLAPITDEQQIDSFCCRFCFFFSSFLSSICVCMHGCLCVHASEIMTVTLPWLCLWHSCVQRCPHRCPGSHNACNKDASWAAQWQHILFFCRTRRGWSHRTSWTIFRQRKTQFLRCVWAVCVPIATAWLKVQAPVISDVYALPCKYIYCFFLFKILQSGRPALLMRLIIKVHRHQNYWVVKKLQFTM